VNCLLRRVIGLAMVVCFAGTPSLLLACAVTCVPGMMTHGAIAAVAPDATPAPPTLSHEHLHHAMPAEPSSAPAAKPFDATLVGATLVAPSTDLVGPDCCAHTRASAAATPAHRADTTALAGSSTAAVFVALSAVRDASRMRASRLGPPLLAQPPRPPLALRI
jgi:hypothetical protein